MPKIRTVTELEEAIRAGDDSITADDLTAAAAQERHEQLLLEARSRAEIADIEAAHQREVDQLRGDIEAVTDDTHDLQTLATAATDALEALIVALRARGTDLDELARRARTLGIRPMDGTNIVTDPSGIGWRAGAGRGSEIALDDRIIRDGQPLDVIGRLVRDLTAKHRLTGGAWKAETAPPVRDQIAAMETLVVAPTMASVLLLRRWGPHHEGAVVETDTATARWLVDKAMAKVA